MKELFSLQISVHFVHLQDLPPLMRLLMEYKHSVRVYQFSEMHLL